MNAGLLAQRGFPQKLSRTASALASKLAQHAPETPTVTETDAEAIIARLKQDAKQGNVSAAKELREWLAREERQTHRDEDMDTWTSWEELSPEQRQACGVPKFVPLGNQAIRNLGSQVLAPHRIVDSSFPANKPI